jgi:ankyrin repeat protein
MRRPELLQQGDNPPVLAGVPKALSPTQITVEKRENVSQAVRESQQLEAIMSLCRHGKYDEVEVVRFLGWEVDACVWCGLINIALLSMPQMLNSPDWTLNIDAMDATGNTLLSVACQNNNKRISKLCLRRGADINTQNVSVPCRLQMTNRHDTLRVMERFVRSCS